MESSPSRITLREAVSDAGAVISIARLVGASEAEAIGLFASSARRLQDMLGLRVNPFEVAINGTVRTDGVAGLVRLTPGVELEVVPKFLDPEAYS
jgi:hypothetical protein